MKNVKTATKKSTKVCAPRTRTASEATITVLSKNHTFRGKRAKMFGKLKSGMTVNEAGDISEKIWNGSRYTGFLHVAESAKLIRINAPK